MNNDQEMKKLLEEEQKKFNMWEYSQRQESIEKYGKDIYADKEIGMKNMRKINNILERIIKAIGIIVVIVAIVVLIIFLFMGWGNIYIKYVK